MMRTTTLPFLFVMTLSTGFYVESAQSAGNSAPSQTDLDYPELNVVPRASTRLELESKKESSRRFLQYLPTQIPAATLLTASLMSLGGTSKSPSGTEAIPALIVSSGLIATTLGMSFLYQPYASALTEINTLAPADNKTTRDQLTRERMSEEAFAAAARLERKIVWISSLAMLGTGGYLLTGLKASEDMAFGPTIAAMVLSLAPLFFQNTARTIYQDQMEYKRKIYGPVASISTTVVASSDAQQLTGFSLAPVALLSWQF